MSAGVTAAVAGATAMLDVSDGLARDARRLAEASRVGLDFDSRRSAPTSDSRSPVPRTTACSRRSRRAPRCPAEFTAIGRVIDGAGELFVDGVAVDADGWDPYAGWDGRAG